MSEGPGVLQSKGSQRVRHDLATEQQQQNKSEARSGAGDVRVSSQLSRM